MKQVQSTFKETLFDWDCEPKQERPSRFESGFSERASDPVRRPAGRFQGLLFVIIAAISAGLIAIAFLGPLLRSLV